ncbi:MAG: GMC oxidoreductase [Betaproteobacteria bacterium]|nr:GMC oxidoreductase [Betaproteobacteria bacterium]
MTPPDFDVLVVGSGPAGVAAAFPLVEAGWRVAMVDGGAQPGTDVPDGEYLDLRATDPGQARWLLGADLHALRAAEANSPKFRAATLAFAFRDFAAANRVVAQRFALVGSMAVGGLSNAWGCGVTRFAASDWGDASIDARELDAAYASVAARVGLSGAADDDLAAFFGVDDLARGAIPLDRLHAWLAGCYAGSRRAAKADGFRMGRARLAVLAQDAPGGRQGCDARGLCLWGCPRRATYSSRHDLAGLRRHAGFVHLPAHVVERLERGAAGWLARTRGPDGGGKTVAARRVVLAAGTVASTAIAMRSLAGFRAAQLLHLPMAAFALWLPRFTGAHAVPGPATAQLAFTLDGDAPQEVCGYTFSTHGLPMTEFLRHAPLSAAGAAPLLRALLPSCIVANCFLPSRLTRSRVELRDDGTLVVTGGEAEDAAEFGERVRARLAAAFAASGARMLPGSFRRGAAGADVHYAGTMPMRASPRPGECDADGELRGLEGVHLADASALPTLPAKSHTLAVMANAHRIGARLARRLATVPP